MKNLVVCCDGTWNTPDEQRDDVARPTNVAKLALSLASDIEAPTTEQTQLVHYELGVGTSADDRFIGGATGYGLSQNIRNGYRFLVENYCPGDQVYLFGFSRGAYTARSLAGLIGNCGILRSTCIDQLDAAFAFYRDRTNQTHPDTIAARIFRDSYAHADSRVFFIGVWDTVGALGIPEGVPGWEELTKIVPGWQELVGFHDLRLGPTVQFAYHALAIDEERPPYRPTLWMQDGARRADQKLEQVWFPGVHSEVGGGTDDSSLSDGPYLWMCAKAEAQGLIFRDSQPLTGFPAIRVPAPAPNYAAPLVQTRRGVWDVVHPFHRLIQPMVEKAPQQSVSSSAARRYREGVDGYVPQGLADLLNRVGTTDTPEESVVSPIASDG